MLQVLIHLVQRWAHDVLEKPDMIYCVGHFVSYTGRRFPRYIFKTYATYWKTIRTIDYPFH